MVVGGDGSKSSLSKRGLVSAPNKEEHKRDRDLDQEKSKRGQNWMDGPNKEVKCDIDWDSSKK